MGISVNPTVLKVLHFLAFAALVIAGATYSYYLAQHEYSWRIRTGTPVDRDYNSNFFFNFAAVGFAIISFLYAIIEFLMIFQIKQIQAIDAGFVKPIVYIVDGICVLGLRGDLGIAAGSLCMAAGVLWLILAIFAAM